MNSDYLESFVAVAEELHFAKAAARLNISQPQLSRRICSLEKSLGTSLFDRSNKWHVNLTSAGKVFLSEAKIMLKTLEKAQRSVLAAACGSSGSLVIGAISSMLGQKCFIDSVREMQLAYPGVTINIIDSTSTGLKKALGRQDIDLALMRPFGEQNEELNEILLFHDRLTVAMANDHPLAKKQEVRIADLKNENIILVPTSQAEKFREYIAEFCLTYGNFMPKVRHETSSSYTALKLAAAKLGVTIVSASYKMMFQNILTFRDFKEFTPVLPIVAVYACNNNSPALSNFLRILKQKSLQAV